MEKIDHIIEADVHFTKENYFKFYMLTYTELELSNFKSTPIETDDGSIDCKVTYHSPLYNNEYYMFLSLIKQFGKIKSLQGTIPDAGDGSYEHDLSLINDTIYSTKFLLSFFSRDGAIFQEIKTMILEREDYDVSIKAPMNVHAGTLFELIKRSEHDIDFYNMFVDTFAEGLPDIRSRFFNVEVSLTNANKNKETQDVTNFVIRFLPDEIVFRVKTSMRTKYTNTKPLELPDANISNDISNFEERNKLGLNLYGTFTLEGIQYEGYIHEEFFKQKQLYYDDIRIKHGRKYVNACDICIHRLIRLADSCQKCAFQKM